MLSATSAEPIATAAALTGIAADDLTLVDDDGSVRGAVRISLARSDLAPETAAAELMATRVRAGEQVLTFVPSRRLAEEVARSAETSVSAGPAGAEPGSVLAYRAGYLANDRRLIERGLADGTIRGVAATNALELGVDIAGLDTVVLCGYPGSRAAFWQQAGRAGRRGAAAEVVLIARANPLDAYLLDHPAVLFDQPVETTVLDPASPAVLGPQLAAAAQELPLRAGDERWFGPGTWALVARLTERGLLRRRPDGWFWTASAASGRQDQSAEHRARHHRHRRGGHRPGARHGRAGRRRPGGAPRRGLPAPGRELSLRRRRLGRRGRRGHGPGGPTRLPDPAGGRRRGLAG